MRLLKSVSILNLPNVALSHALFILPKSTFQIIIYLFTYNIDEKNIQRGGDRKVQSKLINEECVLIRLYP